MSRVITCSFCDPFLDRLMEYIDGEWLSRGRDLSRLAIVFGGKRPALFLKRALARKIGRSYVPPRFLTIDEFMTGIVRRHEPFHQPRDLDQCHWIYTLARERAPSVLAGRESFARFLPWAREVLSFIDQLDLEGIPDESLRSIEANARIGYAVPEDINRLLEGIVVLRQEYHRHMSSAGVYSRGFQYRRAAQLIAATDFPEFDEILFGNLFYLNRSELDVIKTLHQRGKAVLVFQGDERRWPVLRRIGRELGCSIVEGKAPETPRFELKLYSAFDAHSQVSQVSEILKTVADPARAVIVLPNPEMIVPLISQISAQIRDFNISMGYPLRRSSLFSLLESVFHAQCSRGGEGYYTRDYLRALRHPLVKNLKLSTGPAVTRVLVHKIEEALTLEEHSPLAGAVFVGPGQVEDLVEIYQQAQATLKGMGFEVTTGDLKTVLAAIHRLMFTDWEQVGSFAGFARVLEGFLDVLVEKSFLDQYPLNVKIAGKMLELAAEVGAAVFAGEQFPPEDIFNTFTAKVEREIVAFSGSPLKGLQILGLFETRSLNFDEVIALDVNEGVLPRLNIYEPLIPREVMVSLNLDRLEEEEEIQRYQFLRLISSAKVVHLVYQESRDREKSRFVEELVWDAQKKAGRIDAVSAARPSFAVRVDPVVRRVPKTPGMIEYLRGMRFSSSSVNTYLRNPLEFYYRYCLGLREKEDLLDEPENRQVGVFVHAVLEEVFRPYVGRKPIIDEDFRRNFQAVLDRKFAGIFGRSKRPDIFLLKSVLDVRLQRFLDHEAREPARRVKEILFIEEKFEDVIELSSGPVRFVYRMDRVDRLEDGSVMIIDYKTGSLDPMPRDIAGIAAMPLSRETIYEQVKSFQIPLYLHYLDEHFSRDVVNAGFYNLRTLQVQEFIKERSTYDRAQARLVFRRALDFVLGEIFNPDVDFIDDEQGAGR